MSHLTWGSLSKRELDDDSDSEDNNRSSKRMRKYTNGDHGASNVHSKVNHIYFYSGVSMSSINSLIKELHSVTQECQNVGKQYSVDPPPIYLHIHSYGGSVFSAMAAIDAIKNNPVPVYTVIEGCAASAGTLMSVVGKKRYIQPSAMMLIHQLSSHMWGKMDEIEDELVNLRKLMDLIKGVYKEHTDVPDSELEEILKHDLWWDTKKCLEMKLVDSVFDASKLGSNYRH